jgi:hypothetical protein
MRTMARRCDACQSAGALHASTTAGPAFTHRRAGAAREAANWRGIRSPRLSTRTCLCSILNCQETLDERLRRLCPVSADVRQIGLLVERAGDALSPWWERTQHSPQDTSNASGSRLPSGQQPDHLEMPDIELTHVLSPLPSPERSQGLETHR